MIHEHITAGEIINGRMATHKIQERRPDGSYEQTRWAWRCLDCGREVLGGRSRISKQKCRCRHRPKTETKTDIGEEVNGRVLVRRELKKLVWRCNKCGGESCAARCQVLTAKCRCFQVKLKAGDVVNGRVFVSRVGHIRRGGSRIMWRCLKCEGTVYGGAREALTKCRCQSSRIVLNGVMLTMDAAEKLAVALGTTCPARGNRVAFLRRLMPQEERP